MFSARIRRCLPWLAATAVVFFLVGAHCFAADELSPGPRTWTDATGKYKVVATFLELKDGSVILKRQDGRIVKVPEAKLSEEDRQLAARLGKMQSDSDEENPFETTGPPPASEVVRRVEKAIVYVATRDHFGKQNGLGSGIVIDGSGLIATNYHVIRQASAVTVKFKDGEELQVAGYRALDKQHDLAIIQLENAPDDLHALPVAKPPEPRQGDSVIAIGHGDGFEFSVTTGTVAALRSTAEIAQQLRSRLPYDPQCRWIQISAVVLPGSSGGPLLDANGNLIGLNTLSLRDKGVAFAVRVEHLQALLEDLLPEPKPLPVPGSFRGPGVTQQVVIDELTGMSDDFQDYIRKLFSVQTLQKRREIAESENPTPKTIERLRKIAEGHPKTQAAFEALVTITRLALFEDAAHQQFIEQGMSDRSHDAYKWALDRLAADFLQSRDMAGIALEMAKASVPDVVDFQRKLIADTPHREVRALAHLALATALSRNPLTRGRGEAESIAALEKVAGEFGDIPFGDVALKDFVSSMLMEAKHLAVGRERADITGKDGLGEKFTLDEYSGKVILLDFWVDWCPYCRVMYPHERELIAEYGDRGFVVLGVNSDQPERMKSVESKGTVTWRSFADGPQGPITQAWGVTGFPTMYIIDHRDRIRYKGSGQQSKEWLAARIEPLIEERELGLAFDLIEPCSIWTYFDRGKEPGPNWQQPDFDDSSWYSGRGPLGYGRGDEATVISFGGDPEEKYATSYFRHEFTVPAGTAPDDLVLGVRFDDGVAVYLNGTEVARENIAPAAEYGDFASRTRAGNGLRPRYFVVDPQRLREGRNVLAAEVHQQRASSSDTRFDATLSSNVRGGIEKLAADLQAPGRHAAQQILAGFGPEPVAAADLPEVESAFAMLDLASHANAEFAKAVIGEAGNDLAEFPQGVQRFGKTPFRVEKGFIHLSGKNNTDLPERVEGIKVGRKLQRLHILQAAQMGGQKAGTEIGYYTVHYADGSSERIPIACGQDVWDWWDHNQGGGVDRGFVAWYGFNELSRARGIPIRVYRAVWENPHPEKEVTQIDMVSTNSSPAAPFCLAITAE